MRQKGIKSLGLEWAWTARGDVIPLEGTKLVLERMVRVLLACAYVSPNRPGLVKTIHQAVLSCPLTPALLNVRKDEKL